uniref:Uncharacterized protein n=1 Tax=Tetradesmus obliquus TaxID=3088 RepID=A0A383W0Y2_TETOB|eukprot:jgi/Sobl393_1/1177/SZX71345.1
MLSTVDELGTGRLRLPLSYITANGIIYGQPVVAECEFHGVKHRFLCTATVTAAASTAAVDPSVQCGLHTAPLPCSRGSQLLLSVKPVTSKVVTATAIKVLVPEQLLGSPVASAHLQQRLLQQRCTVHLSASVSCQVLQVSPQGPAAAVYRVVPSTAVTLVSSSSEAAAAAAAASAAADSGTPQAAGRSSKSSSKSSSKTKSSVTTDKGTTTSSRAKPSSSGSSSSSSKQAASKQSSRKPSKDSPGSSEEEEAAALGGGGMFGLLDALGDD